MQKRPVRFEDRHGRTLKGVVIEPVSTQFDRDLGFVYLPGAVMGVTAVHAIGLKLGERLSELGYITALIDPPGVGESEGDFPPGTHEEVVEFVLEGNLVEGYMDIVDWMKAELGVERVAFIGHCGGALTGAECAARHDSVTGAFMICPPPLRGKKGELEIERPEIADQYFKGYVARAFDPSRWKRLFTGESDYRTMLTVTRNKAKRFIKSKLTRSSETDADNSQADDRRFNMVVVEAMKRSVEQGKKITVVFGDKDIEIHNYRDLHRMYVDPRVPLVVIEETSHGFTTPDGQARLIELALQFTEQLEGQAAPPKATP